MNLALNNESKALAGNQAAAAGFGPIARVALFQDVAEAERFWRALEAADVIKTPYQTFDLLSAWQKHLGPAAAITPCIVVGFDAAGEATFLWPLGRSRTGPLNVLSFLGGKHANFNMPLWRRDIVDQMRADDLRALLAHIAVAANADILTLLRQPCSWQGLENPFLLLPHQPSPSQSTRLSIAGTGEEVLGELLSNTMRGRLRTKERKLQKLDGYRYLRATSSADVGRLLDAFFPLKAAHMREQALPNIFADASHEGFLREICYVGLDSGKPLVEIHALEGDGELLALFSAVNDGYRASGMFNTYTRSDHARQSPGLILLTKIISDVADRNVPSFDLGAGEAGYKSFFCKEPEPLFDSFLPLTPMGRLAAIAASAGGHVKRQIKQNNFLWNLVRNLRQGLGRSS